MKLKVITHFANYDTEFRNSYYCIEVFNELGNRIHFRYNYCNEKIKVKDFIAGINYVLGDNS